MQDVKQLRGQLRQIAKEILPEILNQEQYQELKKHVDERLNRIELHVKTQMKEMQEHHKNTLGYLVRQTTLAPTDKQ